MSEEIARRDELLHVKVSRGGTLRDYARFVWRSGKWWIAPIILLLLSFALIAFVGSSGAMPFLYTLF